VTTKKCSKCSKVKILEEFGKSKTSKDGKVSNCKSCKRAQQKKYYETEAGKLTIKRGNASAAADRSKWKYKLKQYDLTPEAYDRMLLEQNFVCAICNNPETRIIHNKITRLCVDHDHLRSTPGNCYVRGIICHKCNSILGRVNDSIELLQNTIAYFKEYENKECSSTRIIILDDDVKLNIDSKSKRACHLMYKYNLTPIQHAKLLAEQKGACKICSQVETALSNGKLLPLAVDHCHETGKIRALLCKEHNSLLGACRESIDILERAIAYLRKHEIYV